MHCRPIEAKAALRARAELARNARMVIVVTGVAGAGKTTVGRRLAEQLGWDFRDADDLHSPASIERMRGGSPLGEEHRAPWLARLSTLVGSAVQARRPLVLACSALRRAHRDALLADVADPQDVALVYLEADPALIAERIARRSGHFFPPSLLADQLATVEPPGSDACVRTLTVDATRPPDELVATVREALGV